jgi:dTDP-4-amino-4,6-dideoxygalactose transaminase
MAKNEELPFIVFGAPDLRDAEINEVVETLRSGWIGSGPRVEAFEQAFARYKGVDNAQVAAVSSCSAALHVSMIAAGLGPGDEVVTTAITFCATVNAIMHAGATPILADIDPETFNIDPASLKDRITPRTRAVVLVHFAGRPCDMDVIMAIAAKHDLVVIEDCAHAIETQWKGRRIGTLGAFGCFSFYVTKNVVTGEGGMVIANAAESIERVKILAAHGMSVDAWRRFGDQGYKHYAIVEAGFKYNMTDIQAAIGIHQLSRVEENWRLREAAWRYYQQAFADLPIGRPADSTADIRHAYHLYTILIDEGVCGIGRDEFARRMTDARIGVGIHYLSLAQHPFYQDRFRWQANEWPEAARFGAQTVSLPLSSKLSAPELERVAATVRRIVARATR